MSKKHKKVCTALSYIEYVLILASAVAIGISISAFASLLCIPIRIMGSAMGLRICAKKIAAGIRKYKSIIKKKKRSMKKEYC